MRTPQCMEHDTSQMVTVVLLQYQLARVCMNVSVCVCLRNRVGARFSDGAMLVEESDSREKKLSLVKGSERRMLES